MTSNKECETIDERGAQASALVPVVPKSNRRWSNGFKDLAKPPRSANFIRKLDASRFPIQSLAEQISKLRRQTKNGLPRLICELFEDPMFKLEEMVFRQLLQELGHPGGDPKCTAQDLGVATGFFRAFHKQRENFRRLDNFQELMGNTLRYNQLEVLCRYGDYLAERLGTLRQHFSEKKLETEHKLAENWTETSATLRGEEGRDPVYCQKLIQAAAQGLNWDEDMTIFMVHEYAKRNSLMHAELFQLVDRQDWQAIGERCKEDVEKLRHLLHLSNTNSKADLKFWVQIIEEFGGRWVCKATDGLSWEARPIIKAAIDDGLNDHSSLSLLASFQEDDDLEKRNQEIDRVKEIHRQKKAHRIKSQTYDALKRENEQLQHRIEKLEELLNLGPVSDNDLRKKLEAEQEKNRDLKAENKRFENQVVHWKKKHQDLKAEKRKMLKEESGLVMEENALMDLFC